MDPVENVVGRLMTEIPEAQRLDLGCAIRDGSFNVSYDDDGVAKASVSPGPASLVAFLFQLLSMLQAIGTVPAIDYAKYLEAVAESKYRQDVGDIT